MVWVIHLRRLAVVRNLPRRRRSLRLPISTSDSMLGPEPRRYAMESTFSVLAKEIVEQRVRCRHAEEQLTHLEAMLQTMGVTLWETDRDLRLVGNCGMDIADSYLNCHIGDFYRDVFGIDEPASEPLLAPGMRSWASASRSRTRPTTPSTRC